MKYLIAITITAFFLVGCNNRLTEVHKSDDCQNYYSFIKSKWEKKEGYYQLVDDPPYLTDGEIRYQYFNEDCLKGLPIKRLEKILGKPNKINPLQSDWKSYIYCLNKKCDRTFKVTIDEKGIVNSSIPNPVEIQQD